MRCPRGRSRHGRLRVNTDVSRVSGQGIHSSIVFSIRPSPSPKVQVLLYLFDEDKVTFFASGNLVGSLSPDNDVSGRQGPSHLSHLPTGGTRAYRGHSPQLRRRARWPGQDRAFSAWLISSVVGARGAVNRCPATRHDWSTEGSTSSAAAQRSRATNRIWLSQASRPCPE